VKIVPANITIRELAEGYADNAEDGVVAFDGLLDVRPPYQREFVYKDKQRNAVVQTVFNEYPLNVMYWSVRDDGTFEIIDGQQRTISICQYVTGEFSFEGRYFHNLQQDERDRFLDYTLTVYQCSGTDSDRLAWFKTINIAGEKLTDQELRNAVYAGSWVAAVKRIFSKTNCPAYGLASDYMTGTPIRQDYLETVIEWINDGDVEGYMAIHQHDPNANTEWLYFQAVIAWTKATFPKYRKNMKSVAWGELYNVHKGKAWDADALEKEVARLMLDDEVSSKSGIYPFVLGGDPRTLSLRAFSENQKREAFERQKGVCPVCEKTFDITQMEADHITPWSKGGRTVSENCQMLCRDDNRRKGGI
jgi:hypothetical protein